MEQATRVMMAERKKAEEPVEHSPDMGESRMTEKEFSDFGRFIHRELGIKMPPAKRTMLEARLRKRLRATGIDSYGAYRQFVFGPEGADELIHLIDAVSTNKTDFFREPAHYDYLHGQALPELARVSGAGIERPLRVWSAGCSTGEEAWSLAMVIGEFAACQRTFRYSVLASDISTRVLEAAARAVYAEERAEPVPAALRARYLMRSRDRSRRQVRVVPELRHVVTFRRINLMEADFNVGERHDVIFCRNVLIYFDRETQERIVRRLTDHLADGGYLFVGHSETLHGLALPLVPVAPMVYRTRRP